MKLFTSSRSPLAAGLVLVVALALGATSLQAGATSRATTAAPTDPAAKTVAHNDLGRMRTRIVGETANGRDVTGHFVPLKAVRDDGRVRLRGLVNGVVHNDDGSTSTFSAVRTLRLVRVNDTPLTGARTAQQAPCDILRLVLGPLDLDLLGLQVHLDRVVLTIIAQSGAGNLLGNLLCAVAGLLDDGLGGALRRLTNLLNDILGALRLGV